MKTLMVVATIALVSAVAVAAPRTVSVNVPTPSFADGPTGFPPPPQPQSFDSAMRTWMQGAVSVIQRPDSGLRFIDCPDKISDRLRGDAAILASTMQDRVGGQLAQTLQPMHATFQSWLAMALPGATLTPTELGAIYREYVLGALPAASYEALRPYVADAVIAAGLLRGADLMVTPMTAGNQTAVANSCRCVGACVCSPGATCSCQRSNAAGDDCSPPAASCNVEDLPSKLKSAQGLPR